MCGLSWRCCAWRNVIHDHVSDFFHAVLALQKVLSERGSGDFRQMLMLRDCENLFLCQAA